MSDSNKSNSKSNRKKKPNQNYQQNFQHQHHQQFHHQPHHQQPQNHHHHQSPHQNNQNQLLANPTPHQFIKTRRRSAPNINFDSSSVKPKTSEYSGNKTKTPKKNKPTKYAGAQFQNSPDASALPIPIFFNNPAPTSASTTPSPYFNGAQLLSHSAGEHHNPPPIHYYAPIHPSPSLDQLSLPHLQPPNPNMASTHSIYSSLDFPIQHKRSQEIFSMDEKYPTSDEESELSDHDLKRKSQDLFRLLSNESPGSTCTQNAAPKEDLDKISRDLRNLLKISM